MIGSNIHLPEEGDIHLQISLTRAYLSVARSVLRTADNPAPPDENSADFPTVFSAASVTIIYSFLALESFINYHFYRIYQHAKIAHEVAEGGSVELPIYGAFFERYGSTPLESLRIELKEKIRAVSEAYQITPLHKDQPSLWHDFCDTLKPARDFLVHSVPEPVLFQKHIRWMMIDTPSKTYIEVATGIIAYFYSRTGTPTPDWLGQDDAAAKPSKKT